MCYQLIALSSISSYVNSGRYMPAGAVANACECTDNDFPKARLPS